MTLSYLVVFPSKCRRTRLSTQEGGGRGFLLLAWRIPEYIGHLHRGLGLLVLRVQWRLVKGSSPVSRTRR
jgi:hypothetical protein